MVKSIKKTSKYFIVFVTVISVLITGIIVIVTNSGVQTYILRKITDRVSKNITASISVGKVKYSLLNKLTINDLLILDKNNDTLIYSPLVTVGLRKLDLKKSIFGLGRVEINEPVIKFITDSSGVMNISYYLAKFKKPDDSTTSSAAHFSISQIEIMDGHLLIRNDKGTPSKTKIDFNNIRLAKINSLVENIKIENDSVTFDIYRLSLHEASGLSIRSLSTQAKIKGSNIFLSSFNTNLDSSVINASQINLTPVGAGSYSDFINNVNLDFSFDRSLINTSDLSYVIPAIDSLNDSFFFSGRISGPVSELRGRDITLNYGELTYLSADFDFSGLPDIQNTYIYFGVNSFITNTSDIESIGLSRSGKIKVPPTLKNLGNITFQGNFTGFLTDFVTYGNIRTLKGTISTDISFRPEKDNSFTYNGLIKGSLIDLGEITGKPDLFGDISIEANINGSSTSFDHFAASLTGVIDSVEIRNYMYKNISLNGSFTQNVWDGSIKIREENIDLDILGRFDFSKEMPVFDFTMNLPKANLEKLNITPGDTSSSLSMAVSANFTGNNINNLNGEIKILNAKYRKLSNDLDVKNFTISALSENNLPAINLRSDFVDADIRGQYNFDGITESVKTTLAALFPIEFIKPDIKNFKNTNNFSFNVRFKKTDQLNKIFNTGILLAEESSLSGYFFPDSAIYVNAKSPSISVRNLVFSDFTFKSSITDSVLVADLNSSSLFLSSTSELKSFNFNFNTRPDKFSLSTSWDNKNVVSNKGSVVAEGTFSKNSLGRSLLKVNVKPTDFVIKNELWKISPSVIVIDTTSIEIENLYVKNSENYLLVNGKISESQSDTLNLIFSGLDLETLNNSVAQTTVPNPNKIQLLLKGQINGNLSVTNVYKNFMFESDLIIRNFSMMKNEYGDVTVRSDWDNNLRVVRINASNNLKGEQMFILNGSYNPSDQKFNVDATAKHLPVDFMNPLLKSFASGIKGFATGKINFDGKLTQPILRGSVYAEDASLKIDYLQSRYSFSDSIFFDKEGIKLNNIIAYDEKKNTVKVNGSIKHKFFNNIVTDITLTPVNCMVLNTNPKDNEMFYGTAYATGVVTIKGADNNMVFDISASTGKNTKFNVPLSSGLSVSTYSYISFIDTAALNKPKIKSNAAIAPSSETFEINIDLDLTPDAEVQLIFDSKIGDIIKGTGQSSGPLNINLSRNGDFKMYGDYVIDQGDYLFTLGNIFNKKFTVQKGGIISFNGSIDDAEININAVYPLKASLYEILQDENYKERVNVECHLNLTGKLFNPVIVMDIVLPNATEEARNYLKNAIATDEELSRQFVYLLVMNSFYADPSYQGNTAASTTTTGTTAMAVTTSELLSNQLSNWLSQISNDFDIGFAYRPGNEISSQEVELAFGTQLLNDRVSINGNLDVRGNQTTTTASTKNIAGDFNVEVKLTEKVKFKVFNRANDIITNDQAPYTQGLGIFFRQEFDKLGDLFKRKAKGEMKKEENLTQPVNE